MTNPVRTRTRIHEHAAALARITAAEERHDESHSFDHDWNYVDAGAVRVCVSAGVDVDGRGPERSGRQSATG
jgi:hypothetical protein